MRSLHSVVLEVSWDYKLHRVRGFWPLPTRGLHRGTHQPALRGPRVTLRVTLPLCACFTQAARDTARSLYCSLETLEMLADMRGQFFGMLADAGFAERSAERLTAAGGSAREGADDSRAPYNRHAGRPAVVRAERRPQHAGPVVDLLLSRRWQVPGAILRQFWISSAVRTVSCSATITAGIDRRPARHTDALSQVKAVLCGALYPAVLVMGEGGPRTARPTWLDESAEVCTAHAPPAELQHRH